MATINTLKVVLALLMLTSMAKSRGSLVHTRRTIGARGNRLVEFKPADWRWARANLGEASIR
jgi:hypothetical protein